MNLILEFDDFNPEPEVNCLSQIEKLVKLFPSIKLTMFTTPLYNDNNMAYWNDWCNKVRSYIESDNLRLAIHGLYHTNEEFKFKSKENARDAIEKAESIFNKANLPFIKVFRGPHWGISSGTYEALIDLNYKYVYTHIDYRDLIEKYPNIKSVIYNWNLKDEYVELNEPTVIGHGHTHNVCGNGIEESMDRICSFINKYSPNFLFCNELE